MIAKLNPEQIDNLLRAEIIGRIACAEGDYVYIVPVSYAYDGRAIYVHSLEGRKLDIMRRHPRVCFETDNIKDLSNWQSAVVWGTFRELSGEQRSKALEFLLNRPQPVSSSATTHLGSNWPFYYDELKEVGGVVFEIEVTEKSGRYETSSASPYFV
jgi:uncharacterized protein